MTDPIVLRQTLEADLAAKPRRGPSQQITEFVHVPSKACPVPMVFKLTGRQGPKLAMAATCPRCRKGMVTVSTTMGPNGRTVWPPVTGWPQLCEACEDEPVSLIKRDDIWNAALEQQRDQRRRLQ
jgi:hypothetical protein